MSRIIKTDNRPSNKPIMPTSNSSPSLPIANDNSARTRGSNTSTKPAISNVADDDPVYETITMAKFDKFQTKVFPVLSKIIQKKQFKSHPFSGMWNGALQHSSNPLTAESTLRSIQKVLPVENLQDYRRFLLECPSIEQYIWFRDSTLTTAGFDVHYRQQSIEDLLQDGTVEKSSSVDTDTSSFDMLPDSDLQKQDISQPIQGSTVKFQTCTGSKTDFFPFWTQICLLLTSHAAANPMDQWSTKWSDWQKKGLSLHPDFQQVKQILAVPSLAELYLLLRSCQPVMDLLDVRWDHQILYQFRIPSNPAPANAPDIASAASSETGTISNISEDNVTVSKIAATISPGARTVTVDATEATDTNNPKITSDRTFATVVEETANEDLQEILDSYMVHDTSLLTSYEFVVFHCLVFDTVETWLHSGNLTHSFATTWCKWKFQGLTRDKHWSHVRNILGVSDLSGYLYAVKDCPAITRRIGWMWVKDDLQYWIVPEGKLYADDTILNSQLKLQNLKNEFHLFQTKFDITAKDINTRLTDYHFRLEANEKHMKNMGKNLQASLQQVIETSKQQVLSTMEAQVDIFQRKLVQIMDSKLVEFGKQLQDAEVKRNNIFTANIDSWTDKAQGEIYSAADEATNSFNQQVKASSDRFAQMVAAATEKATIPARKDTTTTEQAGTASRWNVTQETRDQLNQFVPTPPPTSMAHSQWEPVNISDTTGVVAPDATGTTYFTNTGPDGLPWLQFDNLIKRAKITYMGQSDILVFYNQLFNFTNNYGVFLRKLETLKLNMSVCPDEFNGVSISAQRKAQMGNCLYLILQNPDTVPLEYTWARNVINRFATANDGYKVLYCMVKPILNKDIIIGAPAIVDCTDIHEYAQKFDSYIQCEVLAGHLYTPREQITKFTNGLDASYNSAISKVRLLLDNRSTNDGSVPDIPDALAMEALPDTIQQYYDEDNGKPTIRAMTGRSAGQDRRGDKNVHKGPPINNRNTVKVDKACGTCHAWGHLKSQCGGFARFLIFHETANKTDDVTKNKIVANYKADMKAKVEARLQKQKLGTVRQMWEQGYTYEEMENNLLSMVAAEQSHFTGASDEEDDE